MKAPTLSAISSKGKQPSQVDTGRGPARPREPLLGWFRGLRGSGYRVQGLGFRLQGLGFRVGSGAVWGSGCDSV